METQAESEKRADTTCGIGPCQPKALRKCENLSCFSASYSVVMFMMAASAIFLSTQITSIEKQFGISSATSGTLFSAFDIGYLITVLFTTHFLKRYNIPRVLGFFGIIFGTLVLVKAMLNFVQPTSLPQGSTDINSTNANLCKEDITNNSGQGTSPVIASQGGVSWIIWVFGIVLALQGVFASTRTSLSTLYIDDNVRDNSKTAYFIGAITASATFGPAVAYLLGGAISNIPVDLSDTLLSPTDPRWISAWWLGFLIIGTGAIASGIPTTMFPKRMSDAPVSEKKEQDVQLMSQIKGLPLSVWRTLTRPIFFFALLSRCLKIFALVGMIVFSPKHLETQFNIPAYQANLMLGVANVVTTSLGTFLGGCITGKLKMSKTKCAIAVIISSVLEIALNSLGFVFGCDNTPVEGLDFVSTNFSSASQCVCDDAFLPSCGDDRITYFSPCRAGCINQTGNVYGGCSQLGGMSVTPGICDNGCQYLIPYLASVMLMSLVLTMGIVPNYILIIRSVEEEDKAMGVGLTDFLSSLIGFVPSPMLYGYVIDSTCKLMVSYGGLGACALHDIVDFRYKAFGLSVGLKTLALLAMVPAVFLCVREDRNSQKDPKDKLEKGNASDDSPKASEMTTL